MNTYNKKEQSYIYNRYDKFTGVLKTISDYEAEYQRALKELQLINEVVYIKKERRYKLGCSDEFALANFIISRIKNCNIKINQLKQRRLNNV